MIKKLQFTCRKFQDCNFDFTSIHKHHAQFYPKILAGQHTLFLYKQSPSINQIYLQSTIQGQSQNFIPVLCYFYMRPIKICTEVCGGVQTNIYIYIYAQKTLRELHLAAARKATGLPLFASLDSFYQETGGKHFMIEVSRRLHFCFIKVHYSVLYIEFMIFITWIFEILFPNVPWRVAQPWCYWLVSSSIACVLICLKRGGRKTDSR